MAAAAYRAGVALRDKRTGRMHRYEKRKGVKAAFILAPSATPQNLLDRAVLWNAAEEAEARKNSRVAREVILALPHELSDAERLSLCRDMAQWLVDRFAVAVDTAIHAPTEGDGHDQRNHHGHLLFTTRAMDQDGFGPKTRVLDDKEQGPKETEMIRQVWETLANDALARAGFEDVRIDRRTLEDQGIERIPQTHVGKVAQNAEGPASGSLKQQFLAAETAQEKGEKETEGETGKQSGGSSGPSFKSEKREDYKGRQIDYKTIDQSRNRLAFNEEIKKLNARRAAFSPAPLKQQIAELDKLTGLVESRQKHLKSLLTKTTLPNVIRNKIEALVSDFKQSLFIRKKHTAEFKDKVEVREAKTQRQAMRYGKVYRAGLHEQMKEMERNLQVLEYKQKEYQSFKTFVDKIEVEVKAQPKPSFQTSAVGKAKILTPDEFKLRLSLKAEMSREAVRYLRPQPVHEDELVNKSQITLTEKYTPSLIRDQKIKNDLSATKILPTIFITSPKPKEVFEKAALPVKPLTQSTCAQPLKVEILGIKNAIAKIKHENWAAEKADELHLRDKPWFTPATNVTRSIQCSIELKNRTHPTSHFVVDSEIGQNRPIQIINASYQAQKIKTEAAAAKKLVPAQFLPKIIEPTDTAENLTDEFKNIKTKDLAFNRINLQKLSTIFNKKAEIENLCIDHESLEIAVIVPSS